MPQPSHTINPDIETSGDNYASRFAGPLGEYLLGIQQQLIIQALCQGNPETNLESHCDLAISLPGSVRENRNFSNLSILEVGGGHAQITRRLLELGCSVTVHGSDASCAQRISRFAAEYPNRLNFVPAPLYELPFSVRQFDVVISLRLLPHLNDWRTFLRQISRFAKHQLLFDFTPVLSLNVLSPLLFPIKKAIEKNTREYYCHSQSQLISELKQIGWRQIDVFPELAFPLALHRAINCVEKSANIENFLSSIGVTRAIGSPRIISACF